MIEQVADQLGGTPHTFAGREFQAWHELCSTFRFQDTFTIRNYSLSFSWDNKRTFAPIPVDITQMGDRILRHIDRTYITEESKLAVTSTIMPGFNLSDHALVLTEYCSLDDRPKRPGYRMNVAQLADPLLKLRIIEMWGQVIHCHQMRGSDSTTTFLDGIHQARQITRSWGKARAVERKTEESTLRLNLHVTQYDLQRDPQNLSIQERL